MNAPFRWLSLDSPILVLWICCPSIKYLALRGSQPGAIFISGEGLPVSRGFSDAQIRMLGRWKSNAFLKYIRVYFFQPIDLFLYNTHMKLFRAVTIGLLFVFSAVNWLGHACMGGWPPWLDWLRYLLLVICCPLLRGQLFESED